MPTTEYGVNEFFQNAGTSPKMVYDAAGVLGWSPHNMMLQSAMGRIGFVWTGNSATRTGGQPDPSGGSDAVLVAIAAGGVAAGGNIQQQATALTSGLTYTSSAWCKGNVGEKIYFGFTDAATQVLVTFTGSWQRVSETYVPSGTTRNVGFECYNRSGGAHLPAVTFQCWGAQVNRGTTPTDYLNTTTAARFGLALDYDPVTHAPRGLLCEPAGTNLCLRSSEFDNASWTKQNATVGVNAVAAPNGVVEADGVIPTAGSVQSYASQAVSPVTSGANYTCSVFVKNGTLGNNWIAMDVTSGTQWVGWFNLATGAKGTQLNNPVSYNITSVGNGWYRIDVTILTGATSILCLLRARSADGSVSPVTGDGTSPAYYAYGAQAETGSVATSPIPTLTASVTRAVDNYNVTPASINHSATAGSWWADCDLPFNSLATPRLIGYASNSSGPICFRNVTVQNFSLNDSTALTKTIGSALGLHKAASAWQSGDRAITADGLAVVTDAGSTASLLAPGATIGFGNTAGTSAMLGWIRKIRYLPRRPSNAELVSMTTT